MRMIIGTVLIVLILLLSGDRCTYPARLVAQAQQVVNPFPMLFQAAKQNNAMALALLQQQVIARQNHHWLALSIELLSIEQAYQLVTLVDDAQYRRQLFSKLADRGHLNSQFQYALMIDDPQRRLRLLTKVAEQGHVQSILASYHLASALDATAVAQTWLTEAANYDEKLALVYADYLWQQQGSAAALDYLRAEKYADMAKVKQALVMLEQSNANLVASAAISGYQQSCSVKLQMVASTIQGVSQALQLANQFSQDPRFNDFPVCINPPLWLEFSALDCSNDPNTRMSCRIEPLMELSTDIAFTHVIVIGQNGIANVHNGLMYLDLQDDYDVFVHEFAHFAGFVDEYPISSLMAAQFCAQQQAPNLVFESQPPDIKDTHFAPYLQESPNLQLTETLTCQNVGTRAFKPVSEITFLEHHDIGEVPDVYLRIWRDRLVYSDGLTPVYVNFAQWSDARGETQRAQYWWHRYNNYLL
ncbi:hypothetical protein [Aliiglaciecola litoralis]|uniref:IgA Peptidase M64 n=1 Tax=Aliiglaciecola litoralis TaxID=582857 RepID=A0ABN1LCM4_9ALTE